MAWFKKKRVEREESYIELGPQVYDLSSELSDRVKVRIFTLDKFDDVRVVTEAFSKGDTICLASIARLVDLEFGEPHMAVKKMKQAVEKAGGDIAALKGNWIVLTPSYAQIYRKDLSHIRDAISEELE